MASEDDGAAAGGSVETIVVRGVRTGRLPADPTVFSDSIDLRDFAAEQLRLDDVLGELPGVQIRRFGGPGSRSEISIRGSTSSQVVVRIDGVRLDTAQSGSVDLSTLPIQLFERVDVRRGGGAVEVGSGAIGGVIELQPRWPESEPVTSLSVSGGSFGTFEGSLFHGQPLGSTQLALGYTGFKTDGDFEFQRPEFEIDGVITSFDPPSAERINNRAEQHSGIATLRHEFDRGIELRFLDLAGYLSRGEPGFDTGSGDDAGQRTDAHSRTFRNVAQVVVEAGLDDALGGSVRLSHHYERNSFRDPIPRFAAGEPIDVRTDNSAIGGRGETRWDTSISAVELALGSGLEARLESLDSSDRDDHDRRVVGSWLRAEAGLPWLATRIVASVRIDATQGFDTRWLPAVGLLIEPLPWLRLRAHAERSFRAPSFDELFFPDQGFARGNPDLQPERATVVDGGVELAFDHVSVLRNVAVRASGFLHEIDESIVWFPISPDAIQPQNTGRARERGAEVSFAGEIGDWVGLSANATWLDAEVVATGVDLPGRAPLEVSARIRLGDPDRAKLGFEVHHVGEIPVTEGGSQRLPARTTFDLSVAVDLAAWPTTHRWLGQQFGSTGANARVWVAFRGRNLTDQSVRDALFFPQPGRTLSVSLEGSF